MVELGFRTLLYSLTASIVVTPFAARPCSPPCVGWFLPAGGEVPANLPGVRFSSAYVALPREGESLIDVIEISPDGAEQAVPVVIENESISTAVATFVRPLVEGASYRVVGRLDCNGDFLAEERSVTFRAVGERPLPRKLGRIVVEERSAEGLGDVPTSSGSCTNFAHVVARHLTVQLSDDARPWRHALAVRFSGIGGAPFGFADLPEDLTDHLPSDWYDSLETHAYAVCRSKDPGIYRGFEEGEVTVQANGLIPGNEAPIAPTTVTFSLVCGDAGNTSLGPTGGCRGAPAGIAALALFVILRSIRGRFRRSVRRSKVDDEMANS